MLSDFFDESKAAFFVREISEKYNLLNDWVMKCCSDSKIVGMISHLFHMVRASFKTSIIWKIMDIEELRKESIKTTSLFIKYLEAVLISITKIFEAASESGIVPYFLKDTEKDLSRDFIRMIGVIILTAVVTNIFISISLMKEMTQLGWMVKVACAFAGIILLSCASLWKSARGTSLIVKVIARHKVYKK